MSVPRDAKRQRLEVPESNPDPAYCSFYVERKHRFCKTACGPGSRYCPTHNFNPGNSSNSRLAPEEEGAGEERVPCPINGNHTVFKSRLAKHVKVCPDLRFLPDKLPYYAADKHAGRNTRAAHAPADSPPPVLEGVELEALLAKVSQYYTTHVTDSLRPLSEVSAALGLPPATDERYHEVDKGDSRKHKPQHRGLLRCLRVALAGVRPECLPVSGYLELGAGKGGLAVALHDALTAPKADGKADEGSCSDSRAIAAATVRAPHLVVVDFDSFRRKGDARVSRSALPLTRLRIDLKDLDLPVALKGLAKLPEKGKEETINSVSEHSRPRHWAVVGKHLCGACTDFALACVTDEDLRDADDVCALVIATCCHHRCEAKHLNCAGSHPPEDDPATVVSADGISFTAAEFSTLCRLTSWAVSGKVVPEEKRLAGYRCKRVIDHLRVLFLRSRGYEAFMCEYVDRTVTDENICIIAYRP